jgi:serine/threonine protein kinase
MTENLRSLAIGEMLSDYRIDGVLGQGGFGITYLGYDVMLDRRVAIKEYYPREFAVRDSTLTVHAAGNQEDKDTFKWGLEQFIKEAKLLAKLNHPNIIAVRRFFEANGTAYFVMDYCEGRPLDDIIKVDGVMTPDQINKIIYPVLDGLEHLHNVNFLHRDLKPANIYIKSDGSPVLLDFGAARQEIVSHSKSVTSLATPGYAAFEQYSTRGNQGPWTDIYGFAATLYRAITGVKPQDAPDRILEDTLSPVSKICDKKYSDSVLKAIDLGMAVRPESRPQSIKDWRNIFDSSVARSDSPPKSSPPKVKDENKKSPEPEVRSPSATSAVSKTSNSSPTKLIVIVLILLAVVIAAWFMFSRGGNSVSSPEEVKQPVPVQLNQDKAANNLPQTPAPAPAPAQESRSVSQQSTPRPKAPVQNNEPSLDLNKIVKDAVNR